MTASPDFFAENANKSATPPDAQVGLLSEMPGSEPGMATHAKIASVQTGLPSEEEIRRVIRNWQMTPAFDGNDARIAALSTAILDLIRPAFEAKERLIRQQAMQAIADFGQYQMAVEAVEAGFREGWMAGEREGRAYGFTGKLAGDPDRAWNKSKSNRLFRPRSAAARGEKTTDAASAPDLP